MQRDRSRGIALLLAVTVLAALGVISLTMLGLARGERDAGLAAVAHVQARGAAEGVLAQALLGWPSGRTPLAPGDSTLLITANLPGSVSGQAAVRALGGGFYLLTAWGTRWSAAGLALGSARLEQLVLLRPDSGSISRPMRYPRGWRLLP